MIKFLLFLRFLCKQSVLKKRLLREINKVISEMKKIIVAVFLLLNTLLASAASIGNWNLYQSYNNVTEIERVGHIVYVLASNSLFSYNMNDQSVQVFDKLNGLSDSGIAHIAWCPTAKRLVIAYNDSNIDLLEQNGNTINVSDLYTKMMTEDKNINSIYIDGKYAYCGTGFGVLQLNVADAEITNSYNLGTSVDWAYTDKTHVYAESRASNAQFSALLSSNLLDRNNWTKKAGYTPHTTTLDPELLDLANQYKPDGPISNDFGSIRFANGNLYTVDAAGRYNSTEVQILSGDKWTIYDDSFKSTLGHPYSNNQSIDVDPTNPNRVAVGGQTGLYIFENGEMVKHFNHTNSPLQVAATVSLTDPNAANYVLVTTLKYDKSGNLWMFNSIGRTVSLLEYTKNGEWVSHHKSQFMNDETRALENVKSMIIASNGYIWMANNFYRTTSLVRYDPAKDDARIWTSFVNQDGTSISTTRCRYVKEDKEGNIWMGTKVGPLMLKSDNLNSISFHQVKVPRNDGTNYADYLLANIDINDMVVDGGNRKWFGTNGAGVYCFAADNITQLYHFTVENSKLLSNTILSMDINEQTGEIFFGTSNGLCSYMSDATGYSDEMTKDNVYAYPNPVRPEYNGLITIVGLTYNADVKIVTSNGVLVAEGKSNGGTFTWDGRDKKGRRVASGVYMVETATQYGEKGTVCKIAIVN